MALLFALPLLPEILGSRVLVFRDAQVTHWPWRRVAMASLDAGRVPFVNTAASGGEPLLANPNAVLLYPTVLLERAVSPAAAFNLHYLLHVLWAFLGARLLASRLGISPGAALFSGAAYAFSGMMLSYGSAFFNSSASASWLPWCAAAALGVTRAESASVLVRAAAATGLAFGLQLLAGEPAISLLTGIFTAFAALLDLAGGPSGRRAPRFLAAALAGAGALLVAVPFAAALLLPLRAIFPLTYRGQHLYSQTAFGAAPFLPLRAVEWLFPRFGGDPSTIGSGTSWIHATQEQDLVYIWCVTFGVLPLLAVAAAGLRRDFWRRPTVVLVYAAAFALSSRGGWLDARLSGRLPGGLPLEDMLAAFRGSVRGDAVFGAAAVILFALIFFARRPARPGFALALLCTALALPWALPLFVSASAKDVGRRPELLGAIRGGGRLYASPGIPQPDFAALPRRAGLPRFEPYARALAQELIPSTAQAFGLAYVFDRDPDGSYGWFNRLADEAARASQPPERSRLLRVYGARWALAGEGEDFPLFHPVTGVVVTGRHLVLHEADAPLPELRWASRALRRPSLSAALELVRSEAFHPDTEVVLPGPAGPDPPAATGSAALSAADVSADRAAGTVDASGAGHLLFSRTYFAAWRARVDGAPVRVLVANARDLAVAIPAGRHTFEIAWNREPFHRGVFAQGAALLLACAIGIATRKGGPPRESPG
ncbi:MAG: hypothetical protein LC796_05890 [Acidobacteria bacterium]|nr:hypothetical protein [Acidobacteriota bacterium]